MWLFLTANDGSDSINTNAQVVSGPYIQKQGGSIKKNFAPFPLSFTCGGNGRESTIS